MKIQKNRQPCSIGTCLSYEKFSRLGRSLLKLIAKALFILTSTNVYGGNTIDFKIPGINNYKNEIINSGVFFGVTNANGCKFVCVVQASGINNFKNSKFTKRCFFSGATTCKNSVFYDLVESAGTLIISGSQLRNLVCRGFLRARNLTCKKIEINSKKIEIVSSKIDVIVVKKLPRDETSSLKIQSGSRIKKVIFESGNGKIECDSNSIVEQFSGAILVNT